jgi:hypothetical protein
MQGGGLTWADARHLGDTLGGLLISRWFLILCGSCPVSSNQTQ